MRERAGWVFFCLVFVGCSSTIPTFSGTLVSQDEPEAEPQHRLTRSGPWRELNGGCAVTESGDVYCLNEDSLEFDGVPELWGVTRLAADPGCGWFEHGALTCVSLPNGQPRGSYAPDPSRLAGTFSVVRNGCVIDQNRERRCDFGDVDLALSQLPIVTDAVALDVYSDDDQLLVATLKVDGTLVYDHYDYETEQLSRWTDVVKGAVSLSVGEYLTCVVTEDERFGCDFNGAQHPRFRGRARFDVRPLTRVDRVEVGGLGLGRCMLARTRLHCDGYLPYPPNRPRDATPGRGGNAVVAESVAEFSFGENHLCVRSFGGTLACTRAKSFSPTFGAGWRDVMP